MPRRPRAPLVLLALLACLASSRAVAQNAPAVAVPAVAVPAAGGTQPIDTTEIIFQDAFPGPRGALFLAEDVAYRIELRGVGPTLPFAVITVRPLHVAGAPPLVLTPLDDQAGASGGRSYLLIPRHTEEYRLDVTTTEFLHVRVIRDGAETRRWRAAGAQRRGIMQPGFGMRAVAVGPYPRPASFRGVEAPTAGGSGFDACLGMYRNGGCMVNLAMYRRGAAGSTMAIGTQPRARLFSLGPSVELHLGASIAIGGTTVDGIEMSYWMLGTGFIGEWAATRHLALQVELGAMMVAPMQNPGAPGEPRIGFPPVIAIGFRYR